MPADSDPSAGPRLPHTFRPFGVRIAIYLLGGLLALVTGVLWFSFPPEIRAQFTVFQIVTVLVLGLGFYAIGFGLVRSRVVARESGLTIVNGYRSRRYEWNEVLGISLHSGSPWAELDISDGTTVAAVGIQGSDGARAQRQVRQLRSLVASHTR